MIPFRSLSIVGEHCVDLVLPIIGWFWRKYSRTRYEPAEEENVQHNFDEPHATPEIPYEITKELMQCTDLHLYRITEKYQEQLESEIEEVVKQVMESLTSKWRMSEINLEKIGTLLRNNQKCDATQLILESVLGGDTGSCRMFWNALSETRANPKDLMKLLTQVVEIDMKHLHRYKLQNQNRNLNVPKPQLISDIYTEQRITVIQRERENVTGETNTPNREVKLHEIFKPSNRDSDQSTICVVKPSNRDSDQSTICVVYGAAGTGKTTLIQKLIHDWATGMIYKEFSFVLHFRIQKLNEIKGRVTLSSLIVDAYPYLENYLDSLWNEPKRLLFIFDDLDQLYQPFILSDTDRNNDPRYKCTDTQSEYLVYDILRSLLQGDILRGCSVLITTRVWKLEVLHHVAADSTLQVMGFTSEKAKEYFCRYFRTEHNANEIVEFIEQHDILWSMCSDPLSCAILAFSLESFQAQGEEEKANLIISPTKVLSDYVAQLLAKYDYDSGTDRVCLTKVGELAVKGIRQNTLSFEGNEITALDSCPPVLVSAFMFQDPHKQSCGVRYEFRHSVLRDFLAALSNVLNVPISRLKQILDERSSDITGRFSTFSIFLVGLSSRNSTDRLELELQNSPTEVTSRVSEWLTQNVSRRLKDMDRKYTQSMFLCILYCLFEYGDNEIMKEVLNHITVIKLNHLRLKSPDCIVLSRTLISTEVIQELDLSSCFARPEKIRKLKKVLLRCVTLRMNQNNLQDSGVKHIFDILKESKIKTLELKSNRLTDDCLESVLFALTTIPSLLQLNLSNSSQDEKADNQFTDEKLQELSERLPPQKEIKW